MGGSGVKCPVTRFIYCGKNLLSCESIKDNCDHKFEKRLSFKDVSNASNSIYASPHRHGNPALHKQNFNIFSPRFSRAFYQLIQTQSRRISTRYQHRQWYYPYYIKKSRNFTFLYFKTGVYTCNKGYILINLRHYLKFIIIYLRRRNLPLILLSYNKIIW